MRDYAATEGNQGEFLLKREEGGITHFYTLTFREDLQAIKKFAVDDYKKARYYPEDDNFLRESGPLVTHFDVLEKPPLLSKATIKTTYIRRPGSLI